MDYDPETCPAYEAADVESEKFVKSHRLDIRTVFLEVCRAMGLDPDEIWSDSRHHRIVATRMLMYHLLRTHTFMSYPAIARFMRRPNHSTVITARKRYLETVDRDGVIHFHVKNRESVYVNIRPGYDAAMRVIQGDGR